MSFSYKKISNSPEGFRLDSFPVFFYDESLISIIESVIDEKGKIKNFPGIIKEESWIGKKRIGDIDNVRFEAQFYPLENRKSLMIWLIQPSGWEWADDDGFGFSGDTPIWLYSIIDENGKFTDNFRLFCTGSENFYGTLKKFL